MIDHDRALELGAMALDGELSAVDAAALAEHLATCPDCPAIVEAMAGDAQALRDLPAIDAPADLRARILASAAAAETSAVEAGDADLAALVQPDATSTAEAPAPIAIDAAKRRRFDLRRRPAMLAAAASLIVAIVGGTLAWSAIQRPGDVAVVDPTPGPSGSAGPSVAPTLGPPPTMTAWHPVAEITALASRGGEVDVSTAFRVASVDGTPADLLAQRITVEPAVRMVISDGPDGTAVLTPDEPLAPGTTYRFTLRGDSGQTVDTWAFQASQPLRVIGTVPDDTETDVPLDTGIEITFDQDGVVDAEAHVSIEPATPGRFETHGRTVVFVPDRLRPATVYTVTVSRGIAVEGTGEALETDVRFQFETRARDGAGGAEAYLRFANDLFESATASRPTVALWSYTTGDVSDEEEPKAPTSARLDVYRLDDLAAAVEAFQELRAIPRWSQWNAAERLPTDGLRRVLGVDARLEDYQNTLWTALPETLDAGWYLLEVPSATHPTQAILQVTDVSGYLAVSDTQTLVWANDLATGDALDGATVTAVGSTLGTTGDDGTLLATTPAALLPADDCADAACHPVVIVQAGARSAFLPATGARDPDGRDGLDGSWYVDEPGDDGYWRVFASDRTLYRRTDTVNVWGALRDRDTNAVPDDVVVRMVVEGYGTETRPTIVATPVTLGSTGAFTGSLRLDDVPEGEYSLQLMVGERVVATRGIRIDRILKPAYQLDVTTGHHVYVAGDRIRVTATATFFEGTPVPGVELRVSGAADDEPVTDATGTAIVRTIATVDPDEDRSGEPRFETVYANPARAEEGEIAGASREFMIFPSHWTMAAEGVVRDGRVRVSGAVHVVDLERIEREAAAGTYLWELDPRGVPVAGTTVTARFVELIRTRRQSGTEYDFIEKRVVPVYEYDYEEREAGSIRLTTRSDGTFSGSIAAPSLEHDYHVFLSATDDDGHVARAATGAGAVQDRIEDESRLRPQVQPTTPSEEDVRFGIGETVDVTMTGRDVPDGGDDRYLFHLAQRGLRSATVQDAPRYRLPFPDWGAPNLDIGAVRFTGQRYLVAAGYTAAFRATDRAIDVTVTADRERYEPGGRVGLDVQTRDADGRPVAATVMLRVVDEKLFTIDGAEAADPLGELYAWLPDGIRSTYSSHRSPVGRPEGGDTTGGGGRDAFADAVLFQAIETGPDGRGSTSFTLSDDLTAWRVSAAAVTAQLQAGEGTLSIPVGLPFFVELATAPEYLVTDRPTIALRAYGSGLTAGDPVTFDVRSESLGLDLRGLSGEAFVGVGVPLPALTVGSHPITVTARTGSGSTARSDELTRSIVVVASRLTRTITTYDEPTGSTTIAAGADGMTEVLVSDAGAGRHVPLLTTLASVESIRLERTLAADLAAAILVERFGSDRPPTMPFEGERYQTEDGGLAVVPHASSDLEASVMAALVAADRFDQASLEAYFRAVIDDPDETRERRNLALAGLAGMGAGVLSEMREAMAEPGLTVRERLWLGLGAAALGDAATARTVAGDLVTTATESLGAMARLRTGTVSGDITEATALLAMLLAGIGDPTADRFWAYVEGARQEDTTTELQAIGVVRGSLAWSAPVAIRFATIIDGQRTTVELEPGEGHRLLLTPAQAATFAIEPMEGRIGLTTTRRDAAVLEDIEVDPDLAITRTVDPTGAIAASDLVVVDLVVTFGAQAPDGCHLVTELVPSGLTPVGVLDGWFDPETGEEVVGIDYPLDQVGQRVTFCAERPAEGTDQAHLRYLARVVSTGTYTWEPAIVGSRTSVDRAGRTPATTVVIDD